MKTKKVKLNKKAKRRLIIAAILAVCVLIASFAVYFTASVYSQIKDFDVLYIWLCTREIYEVFRDSRSYG